MEITEFLLARIAEDEARVRPMLSEAWPEEVVVQVGDGDRQACVAVGPQEAPKAYLRVWRPGTEHQVEFGWQAYGIEVWGRRTAERVLAECDAKRRIITEALPGIERLQGSVDEEWGPQAEDEPERLLRLLALPYAEHEDYQQEWKP